VRQTGLKNIQPCSSSGKTPFLRDSKERKIIIKIFAHERFPYNEQTFQLKLFPE